jgi:hypothetical protein
VNEATRIGVGAILVCNLFDRIAKPPRHLVEAAWRDAGYVIDAPTMILAGSHRQDLFDDDLGPMAMETYYFRGFP